MSNLAYMLQLLWASCEICAVCDAFKAKAEIHFAVDFEA